ncbi:Arylsulfatase [Pontiella desulfatans]|uniref:Arylsulfatase n=1 Tax=Pontiella desulfatans TaxID=2750659 RepID=A0A6C2UA22_PONDE|nr:sulfatase S1_8 [Kiritimatiellales bacterium]VGO16226.1 Arylsulfatase [Pontiella desulfatans]
MAFAVALQISLSGVFALEQPNILWLTSEDNSAKWIGCYGNAQATTPNIDRLAAEGFRYAHCYANATVCAPSRSTWITGLQAVSTGTHPMRSRYPIPHDQLRYYPDHLREAGYYVTNHEKTDYNIGGRADNDCWDSGERYGWRGRNAGQPFFCVINFLESHESRAFGLVDRTRHDPDKVKPAAYHPDLPVIRQNYAHYMDAVENMDAEIGRVLAELEKDGLADDTIVIYNSDHGGVMFRSKRFLYDSGTHCPLIIRIPAKFRHLWPNQKTGTVVDRLVSFVDMPATWLSLAGADVPERFQGTVFLGEGMGDEPTFHFSFRERADERIDPVRSIRTRDYIYIKNYLPFVPGGQHLMYPWIMKATQVWSAYDQAGKTDAVTGRFFRPRPPEELYCGSSDPDNVRNLVEDPALQEKLAAMRARLRAYQLDIHDSGLLPESERARLTAKHGITIYELVRDPALYDLPTLLDAADLALEQEVRNLPELLKGLRSEIVGVRYWSAVGLVGLAEQARPAVPELKMALNDESHEVRIMAAYALVRLGETREAYACFRELMQAKSYALLSVLNAIDWLGDEGQPLIKSVQRLSELSDTESDLRAWLLEKNGFEVELNWAQQKYIRLEQEELQRREQAAARPNILYINADDLGVADVGFMGNAVYHTPNLDRLAAEGMVFTCAYAPAANCAPSRAACLSGQQASRTGVYTVGNSARGKTETRKLIPIKNRPVLSDEALTIADVLKDAGYTTCQIGKWHVGKDPAQQGIDINIGGGEWGGAKSYFSPYRNPVLTDGPDGEYLTDRLTDEAIRFVRDHRTGPFFLYLPYYTVHTPLQGRPDLVERYKRVEGINADYAAMVEALDENIGRLLESLEEFNLSDNTLVIFTSDNGGIRSISRQDPYRAGKGSYYEGGIRVPLTMRWPGTIRPGSTCAEPVTGLDFFPTLVHAAGADVPAGTQLDGVNLMPVLTEYAPLPERALFWHFPIYLQAYDGSLDDARDPLFRTRPGSAMRFGKWKLHHYFEDDAFELYDLETDIGERNNLAESNPEQVKELKRLLNAWRKNVNAPVPTGKNPKYDPDDV